MKILKQQNIKRIQITSIDNLLTFHLNPLFLGDTIYNDFNVNHLVVEKAYPEENLGMFGFKNGKFDLIEYIYFDKEN